MNTHTKNDEEKYELVLRFKGIKVTPVRLKLVKLLSFRQKPLSLAQICAEIPDHNESTICRTLKTFARARLAKKITLDAAKNLYEFYETRLHFHHIICTSCGFIENVNTCTNLHKARELISTKFPIITDHSLEFFGICNGCVKK